MKYQIVFVPFAFANSNNSKPRPALCLNEPTGRFGEVLVAFFTSQTPPDPQSSDILVNPSNLGGTQSGLKKVSTLRLHKMTTVNASMIGRKIGELSPELEIEVAAKLRQLFGL